MPSNKILNNIINRILKRIPVTIGNNKDKVYYLPERLQDIPLDKGIRIFEMLFDSTINSISIKVLLMELLSIPLDELSKVENEELTLLYKFILNKYSNEIDATILPTYFNFNGKKLVLTSFEDMNTMQYQELEYWINKSNIKLKYIENIAALLYGSSVSVDTKRSWFNRKLKMVPKYDKTKNIDNVTEKFNLKEVESRPQYFKEALTLPIAISIYVYYIKFKNDLLANFTDLFDTTNVYDEDEAPAKLPFGHVCNPYETWGMFHSINQHTGGVLTETELWYKQSVYRLYMELVYNNHVNTYNKKNN